ncbi:MAG TPA: 23S rRNA (uracil(1939)-C(5))-methyltransferase RlmD [Steroidobacteraceae bacterium]|nr:23S rRNA (uracil(1939)-C(5))-methyltransferase RlmD [Steroidobacteraceae bacterium]
MARELNFGALQEADIVDLTHDGRGVARVDGKAVFIDGALPGERVRFRVLKRRRHMDEGGLVEVLRASPDRVVPACAHFGVCGGCSLQHLSPAAQLEAKERQLLDNLERIGRVRPERVLPPLRGPEWAYRRRARLGVKYVHKKGRVLAGFREREKPYLADVQRCEVLLEPLADLPRDLAALVETLSLREKIPQVEVAAGDPAAGDPAAGEPTTALVFRVLEPPGAEDVAKLAAFGAAQRVDIYLQTGGLDTIRPLREHPSTLSYAVDAGRVRIEFGPADFIQINREINVSMVDAAVALLQPGAQDSVLDLFCGLGNFTLPLARRALNVTGVEGDSGLVSKAGANAARNGVGNAAFFVENLFEPAQFGPWARERYQLVLLDPPRAGAAALLPLMTHWRPRRVVYISCHPGSLARDAEILVHTQGFKLTCAGVMDMFPHTTHVESIAVFEAPA